MDSSADRTPRHASSATVNDDISNWLHNSHHQQDQAYGARKPVESMPLIHPNKAQQRAVPLAKHEIDDLNIDDTVSSSGGNNLPYPGVDDGFFTGSSSDPNTDAEIIPDLKPRLNPEGPEGDNSNPPSHPSDGSNGVGGVDGVDGVNNPVRPQTGGRPSLYPPEKTPSFPYAPGTGYGPGDVEHGMSDFDSIPDVNVYQHKKTLAQGMMDLALFSANANQLRYVLESYERHPYYYPSLVMISLSLILQIVIGIGLIWNSRYNVKDDREICIANKINNYTVIGIFIVTSVNVFISAFGVATITPNT